MTVSKKLILSHCPYSHVDRLYQASVFPVSTFMHCGRAYTENSTTTEYLCNQSVYSTRYYFLTLITMNQRYMFQEVCT